MYASVLITKRFCDWSNCARGIFVAKLRREWLACKRDRGAETGESKRLDTFFFEYPIGKEMDALAVDNGFTC